jgi:hypothetical protein
LLTASSPRSRFRPSWSSCGCPWLCAPISIPALAASVTWLQVSIVPGRRPADWRPASAIQPVVTNTVAVKPCRSSSGSARS